MDASTPQFDPTPSNPAAVPSAPDPIAVLEAATIAAGKAGEGFAQAVKDEAAAFRAVATGAQLERCAHFLALQALSAAWQTTIKCASDLNNAKAAAPAQ